MRILYRHTSNACSTVERTPALLFAARLALVLLTLMGIHPHCAAQAPDLASSELWQPDRVPFSFSYNGDTSTHFLSKWQSSSSPESVTESGTHTYSYKDPQTHLLVIAEVRRFREYPNAVDWVLRFRNEGTADTPILENILPLDWSAATSPGQCVIHHGRGSSGAANDFEPLEEHLQPGDHDQFGSSGGDSSSGASLPFFNLQMNGYGIIGAIGWTGNWQARFLYGTNARTVSLSAGMRKTHLLLHPGEEIRTPRIVMMSWTGADWAASQNQWRQLILEHYTPRENNHPMRGPVLFGTWGSEPIDKKLSDLRFVHDSGIPVTLYGIDAGWFGHSVGSEDNPENPWWKNRGNWYASPTYYPQGLRPLGDLAHTYGIGFSVWVEPETATGGTQIVRDHPAWFLHSDHPRQPDAMLLDLGNPAARQGITDMLNRFITDFGMTWYRQDFNIEPERYWELADQPDRLGMTEIRHIEGLYKILDDLLAAHPGLRIDNCASGGRRLDIEMMSRSFVVWRTDYGYTHTLAEQAQTQALAPWAPETMGFETNSQASPWLRSDTYATPTSLYLMRLAYSAGYGVNPGVSTTPNKKWIEWMRDSLQEYSEVQPYFYADFYALLPYSLDDQQWTAWQFDRQTTRDGMVIVLRRPGSSSDSLTLSLKALHPGSRYKVEVREAHKRNKAKEMSGSKLISMKIKLKHSPDSSLVFYHEE